MITITHLSGFGRGKSKTFNGPSIILGTDPSCDVRFDATWDKEVSPRHAQISILNGECVIDDLGSVTGVWIGGRKITREELRGTVEVTLGQNGQRLQVQVASVPAAAAPAQHAPAPAYAAPQRGPAPSSSSSKAVPIAIGIAALLGFGFFGAKQAGLLDGGDKRPPRRVSQAQPAAGGEEAPPPASTAPAPAQMMDTDTKIYNRAKEYESAVGIVVRKGMGNGTAWAVGPRMFATNAHVAEPVGYALEQGASVYIAINKNPDLRYKVLSVKIHPSYYSIAKRREGIPPPANIDGKPEDISGHDVALMFVDADPPVKFKLADESKLRSLDSGHRIAFLGFPTENLIGDNVDIHHPAATMQSGIITSVSDFWMARVAYKDNKLIRHNMGATGGASGSPLFDADGDVIGVLCAGNITSALSPDFFGRVRNAVSAAQAEIIAEAESALSRPGISEQDRQAIINRANEALRRLPGVPIQIPVADVIRAPSAAMVNFGQRIDMLVELMNSLR